MVDINLESVISSNISAVGFDIKSGTMRVQFTNGAIYDAAGAKQSDYDEFKLSTSKGVYFNKVLKQAFAWSKIEKKGV